MLDTELREVVLLLCIPNDILICQYRDVVMYFISSSDEKKIRCSYVTVKLTFNTLCQKWRCLL
jgi:hypothetical protein